MDALEVRKEINAPSVMIEDTIDGQNTKSDMNLPPSDEEDLTDHVIHNNFDVTGELAAGYMS